MERIRVWVPLPTVRTFFTYTFSRALPHGCIVCVPFGAKNKLSWGVVWNPTREERELDSSSEFSLKAIHSIHPTLYFAPEDVDFLCKASWYTMIPLGPLLKMALPIPILPEKKKSREQEPQKPTEASPEAKMHTPIHLHPSQEIAYTQLLEIMKEKPSITMLEGVTGAGKTEVCLKICEEVWREGKQVLILVPEIALSQQWERRLERYFHVKMAQWHSTLSPAQRQKIFHALDSFSVIIGARSAVFLPYTRLGLIIVDEEHDSSYKQEEGSIYHGRDMALLRGHHKKIPVFLLSATPSLESLWNIRQKKYHHVTLPERYGASSLPLVHMIDLRQHPPGTQQWISLPLREALHKNSVKKEQSLLFLNRRGYATLVLCYHCGHRESCIRCRSWLTLHTRSKQPVLRCHYCTFSKPLPEACPECHKKPLCTQGAGVDQIQQEVLSFLPEARVEIFSSDTLASPKKLHAMIQSILQEDVDIVIGTQMIAKGHHFPLLTCVGILDTDFALTDPDIRGCEHMAQLLYQVTGRGGRATHQGHTYIQTAQPQHPLFRHIQNHTLEKFLQEELDQRIHNNLPPLTRLAMVHLSGKKEMLVEASAWALHKKIPAAEHLEIFGPCPSPLSPLRQRHRWRFLLKAPRSFPMQSFLARWIAACPLPSFISCRIDIDPHSFL